MFAWVLGIRLVYDHSDMRLDRRQEAEMTQEEFESKWYHKIVRQTNPIGKAAKYPDGKYLVTATVINKNDFIFTIMHEDHRPPNYSTWISIHLPNDFLDKLSEYFEIVGEWKPT